MFKIIYSYINHIEILVDYFIISTGCNVAAPHKPHTAN